MTEATVNLIDVLVDQLRRLPLNLKGVVRSIHVKRTGPDSWSLWTPGNCTCSPASLVGITTQECAETIAQLRAKRH